ncbi:MAG: hypothetical protein RSA27_06505, partial [Oscillospiraceae bacterium]
MKKMKRVLTGALACTMILSGSMLAMATETQNDIAINPNADQTATTGQQKPGAEPISAVSPTLNTVASIPYCEFIRAVVVVVDGEQPQIMDAHYATPYMIKAKELDLIQGRELEKWNTPATYDEMTAVLDKLDESQKNAAIESLNSLLVDTVEVNGTE